MRRKEKNILKVLSILILAIILMMKVSIAVTTGTITSDTVRVRKEPTTKSSIVGLVSIGDKVQVIEKSGDWYKITCEYEGEQVTGYVRGDLIDVKEEEKVSSKDVNTSTENEQQTDSNDTDENLENTTTNESSEDEKSNLAETLTEQLDNSSEQEPDAQDKETTDQIENQSQTVLTTLKIEKSQIKENSTIKLTDDLDIKILPVVNSTNIATISSGTEVKIVENINQWVRIETEEQIGWARIEQ